MDARRARQVYYFVAAHLEMALSIFPPKRQLIDQPSLTPDGPPPALAENHRSRWIAAKLSRPINRLPLHDIP